MTIHLLCHALGKGQLSHYCYPYLPIYLWIYMNADSAALTHLHTIYYYFCTLSATETIQMFSSQYMVPYEMEQ